jgi:hypothetical protein
VLFITRFLGLSSLSSLWLKICTKDFLHMASHTDGYIYSFSAYCKHVPCNTLTHSTNEDLLNIKCKGDAKSRTLSLREEFAFPRLIVLFITRFLGLSSLIQSNSRCSLRDLKS